MSDRNDWIWLPSEYMVADFGTKFTSMTEIDLKNDWFHSRLFCMPESNWPIFEANKDDVLQQIFIHNSTTSFVVDEDAEKEDTFNPSNYV